MKKLFSGKNIFVAAMCAVMAAVFVVLFVRYVEFKKLQEGIAEKVLRFHVVANSDSEEDQTIKLAVRDAVGTYMAGVLQDVKDEAACEKLVIAESENIAGVTRKILMDYGAEYDVSVSLERSAFPKKKYGAYTFPAGKYRALKVVLGDGGGANWWCVMYPNMCFAGSVYEVVDEDAKESLRAVLSQEEYEKVLFSGNVRVKSKYYDLIREYLTDKL